MSTECGFVNRKGTHTHCQRKHIDTNNLNNVQARDVIKSSNLNNESQKDKNKLCFMISVIRFDHGLSFLHLVLKRIILFK